MLYIILGLIVLVLGWVWISYNRLVTLTNRAKEAWSDIQVQLKRRYDLIPNLVETVKGYATHESTAFENVTKARAAAMGASFLAPDIGLTKQRLKPEWVSEWLKDPQRLQEGTMMPGFFPDGQSPMPDLLGGDYLEQIRAIRDYLYRYQKDSTTPASETTSE